MDGVVISYTRTALEKLKERGEVLFFSTGFRGMNHSITKVGLPGVCDQYQKESRKNDGTTQKLTKKPVPEDTVKKLPDKGGKPGRQNRTKGILERGRRT